MSQTCLIAAHDPWIIQLLRIYSEESGLLVMQAFEGQDVAEIVQREQPTVILLELDLPGQIKGRDVLQGLKESPSSRNIPVLVLSWQDQGFVRDTYQDSVAYLQEPITYDAFTEALQKVGVCYPSDPRNFDPNRGQNARKLGH